jgi:hypothetical protein
MMADVIYIALSAKNSHTPDAWTQVNVDFRLLVDATKEFRELHRKLTEKGLIH